MRRNAWLFLAILFAAALLFAADNKTMKKTGAICDSQCVTKVNGLNTCDPECTAKSGKVVLVEDSGKVMQIENQDMATPHTGKHVKMTCVPSEAQREQTLRITEISQEN